MWHRFFKLIYAILFIGVIIFIPVYFIIDSADRSSYMVNYKVKCIDNGKYIVLQGSNPDNFLTTTKAVLESKLFGDNRKEYNFYCQFYTEIQPHITKYIQTTNTTQANIDYFNFKNEKLKYVSAYPELFVLEKQYDDYFWSYAILYPLIDSLTYGLGLFIFLQILKNFYTYIKFGEFTLNPLRSKKK